jgi:hypothetical protein
MLESLVVFSRLADARDFVARIGFKDDLAVLRLEDFDMVQVPVLPLAKSPGSPGQLVTVIGYPMA